jgi:hypothetical protein
MVKELSTDEAEEFVLDLLRSRKKMTTNEVEEAMSGLGFKCIDGPARVLSKLKFKGLVKGKLSIKDKGWVWWV